MYTYILLIYLISLNVKNEIDQFIYKSSFVKIVYVFYNFME